MPREGLVYRYRAHDGLPGSEGAFWPCSFWMVNALADAGRKEEARELFEAAISYIGPLGLASEEVDVGSGRMIGNYPQAITHLGIANSIVNLCRDARHAHGGSRRT